jgi:hypothetical protein
MRTVFIELGERPPMEEFENFRNDLSEIHGIQFIILPPGDGPKYGVEETVGEYGYKIWADSKDELMAIWAVLTRRENKSADAPEIVLAPD